LLERKFTLESIAPIALFGVNNINMKQIKTFFPKMKIMARGHDITYAGSEEEMDRFEEKLNLCIRYFQQYNQLTAANIEKIMSDDGGDLLAQSGSDGVIVHGNNGIQVKARTPNQRRLVDASEKNDMVFAIGPAGTGKTYTAVALAVRALKNKEVKRIILTRPAVEAGENLGFLPGDLREKLDPYLQPLYDALRDMIPHERLSEYFERNIIQIAPLAFMRGRTLDNAFVILDEAQNATEAQLKMFLTRMGRSAKFMITGDITQVDLPPRQKSGLVLAMNILVGIEGIEIIKLDQNDIIRHRLVNHIINAFDKNKPE
jgi:phosphate starvation-inducible protein PhoH and related proteins